MAEGDPRYVGYAVAALEPWRGARDFRGALQDLQDALQRDPEHVGARSWRAAIFMVGAQYVAGVWMIERRFDLRLGLI